MLKVSDYRNHAEECRRLARQAALPEIREQLLDMAKTWDELANHRETQLSKARNTADGPQQAG
jgi:hypothetical protein